MLNRRKGLTSSPFLGLERIRRFTLFIKHHSQRIIQNKQWSNKTTKTKQSKNIALGANPGVCSTGAQDQTVQEADHMEGGSADTGPGADHEEGDNITTVQEAGRMESGTADTGPGSAVWKAAAAQAKAW